MIFMEMHPRFAHISPQTVGLLWIIIMPRQHKTIRQQFCYLGRSSHQARLWALGIVLGQQRGNRPSPAPASQGPALSHSWMMSMHFPGQLLLFLKGSSNVRTLFRGCWGEWVCSLRGYLKMQSKNKTQLEHVCLKLTYTLMVKLRKIEHCVLFGKY